MKYFILFVCAPMVALTMSGCASQPTDFSTSSISDRNYARDNARSAHTLRQQQLAEVMEERQIARAELSKHRFFNSHDKTCRRPNQNSGPEPELAFSDSELSKKQFMCIAAAVGEAVCEEKMHHEIKDAYGPVLASMAAGGTCYGAVNLIKSGKVDSDLLKLAAAYSAIDEGGAQLREGGGFFGTIGGLFLQGVGKVGKISLVTACIDDATKQQQAPITKWKSRNEAQYAEDDKDFGACEARLNVFKQKDKDVGALEGSIMLARQDAD